MLGFKTEKIEIRLNPIDKKAIKQYCQAKGITISEFVRQCCLEKIKEEN